MGRRDAPVGPGELSHSTLLVCRARRAGPTTPVRTARDPPVGARLALELRTQVDAFHAATGQPVSIVAESEGSVVALAYLAPAPDAPVRNLVVLSPLLAPDASFTRRSAPGWGVAAGTVLDGPRGR